MAGISAKRPRLNIYLADEETRRQIRVAAAKRDLSITEYCARAIEEQLVSDGERPPNRGAIYKTPREKLELLARMDERRQRIGPIGTSVTELVTEGRRR